MKSDKLFTLCINQKKLVYKYTITKLNQCRYKIDTIFMNLENSKTSKPHVLLLDFTYKIDLQRGKKDCFIKSQYLLYMEKHKKDIQQQ